MIALSDVMVKRHGGMITPDVSFSQFKDDVAYNASRISAGDVILFENSSYRFLVGLMAALYAGAKISLPPNDAKKTLSNLSGQRLDVELGKSSHFTFSVLESEHRYLDFYTSGSSGESKCVRKTVTQIENEIEVLETTWGGVVGKSLALATVSHQHIYGMLFKVLWSVCAGRPFHDEMFEYWENLANHITSDCFIISSPAHLTRYPQLKIQIKPKIIFSSGAPLSFEASCETDSIFSQRPTEVFGSTETGGIAYRQQTGPSVAWQPFDVVETTSDEAGVLSIRSPYLENDEWHKTSDQVEFVEGNKFVLKGRTDRVVKVEGKRVSLPEVERVLSDLEIVDEASVLITKDQRQSLSAVLVLNDQGKKTLDEMGEFKMGRLLRSKMKLSLESAALPRRWRFVEEIPLNSQGKRLKADLLELYLRM